MPVETSQRHKIPLSICFHKIEEETVEDNLQKEKKQDAAPHQEAPGHTWIHLLFCTLHILFS